MNKYLKVLLAISLGVILLLGGVQIYLSYFLDDQLQETAVTRFHKAMGDEYELTIDNLELWIPGRKLNISGIEIASTENNTGTDVRLVVADLNISGIGVLNYLIGQKLNVNQVELVNPEVYVTTAGKSQKGDDNDPAAMTRKMSEAVLQKLNSLTVSTFSIRRMSLVHERADLPLDSLLSFDNSDIRISDITVDSASLEEEKIIPAENLSITFRNITHHTTNELYNLSVDQLMFSTSDSQLVVDSLRLNPKYDKVEFANQVKYEIDRTSLQLSRINWSGIDVEQLNNAKGFFSKHVAIQNIDLDIHRDKRPPPPPDNRPPLPYEMLQSIPFPFSVDSISVSESDIRYSERVAEAEKPGYIDLKDLTASFKNVSNNEKRWKQGEHPTLLAETSIMGEARLNAEFNFAVFDSSYRQQIKGTLEEMNMQHLNDALVPLAFVRIDDGQILGMKFDMTLDPKKADGEVILRYEDLKVSLLNKDTNSETLGKKIISFLANELKLESENTGDDLRVGEVDFERDQEKSTFNYWWKSLLSGLKSSIGF